MVSNMNNKEKYRELCKKEKSIPIFSKDWWLDAVAGDNWDVAIVEKNGEVIAALPFVKKRKAIFDIISMPKLTQNLGIWVKYPENQKYTNRLSFEKEVYTELIDQLPKFDYFKQNFHYNVTNWLPFYWKGFEQTTRYTYVIEDLTNVDKIFASFRENIRREIRKATKKVEVISNDDIELFYDVNKLTFERQNLTIPYSLSFLINLDQTLHPRNARKIFFAKDKQDRIHSAIYIVWDENSAYYLMGGGDPNLRNSGATSLLMWTAINYVSDKTQKFDFEGSMIEPIERFFRAFGAVQKPYFQITKTNSRLLKARKFLKEVFK
ncbi:GNAT family N-acetyltransferase [Parageobacillus sp. G301]|uniref:GNAT family N-acetyltransferase n=1 Tax=Parageobacillus sp. G301 TaxID=2998290 RepID=UPI00249774F5|nr:GNAT family N-acetyltransferase [Parageobacillus sp. G301]GLH64118.1 hypothetical protein PG301_19570 [Parageobacillus sp. G301]